MNDDLLTMTPPDLEECKNCGDYPDADNGYCDECYELILRGEI
jgi:hypothetical protein